MFLRIVPIRRPSGKVDQYVRLVESYYDGGKIKQRTIANLGRKELLAPHVDRLVELLRGEPPKTTGSWEAKSAAVWGQTLVARVLWEELGFPELLEASGKRSQAFSLAERAFILVAHRLICPGSEHALAQWLETDYVPDRRGERILPIWKENGRVRVDHRFLWPWYRTLDELIQRKEELEEGLFSRLRDLFSLQPEMVFYDLTSSYFEGEGPEDLAQFGYSRDRRGGNRQILLEVVMVNGWPIAHHVFRGNLKDGETVQRVVEDLEKRFGLQRVVFVGDRGMVSTANLGFLWSQGHGFLVGLRRRRSPEVLEYLCQAQAGCWQPCAPGSNDRVCEVPGRLPGQRIFVVESAERLAYEQAMREAAVSKIREELEKLAKRVEKGELRDPEKIGAAAGRILSAHHGHRYFRWSLSSGRFEFSQEPLEEEKLLEGKYLILTEEKHLSAVEAVCAYKELSQVERAFRKLKDVLEMRPIYHHDPQRVQAHVFVAALAFLLDRLLEKKLKLAKLPFSTEEAWTHLRTVHVVEAEVGGTKHRGVTAGNRQARQILSALKISSLEPWKPKKRTSKTPT
ncbi:IS1634 family transposase [Candidatus Methylacidiphilum fumarolicum]|uniref:Transposase n=1 Tax=Candidatus Methylacidiphilum fumarolicum TaxID=591154 RepID=A0ABM9IB51_9BACT|nr:IS1634 family transposase [Candidatus Methylacidiphilum fumarolicum]CAI9084877.1 transposase [Candidatus Methylacidiphilum fumarolicum]